jgi:xylan 1,4-beta-xylosidase
LHVRKLSVSRKSALAPDASPYCAQICSAEAVEVARDGARQGSVLLKNENNTLPLVATSIKSAAVIGPNANYSEEVAMYYAGTPCFNSYTTLAGAVTAVVPTTSWLPGLPAINSTDTSQFAAAIALALSSDVVVLALGNSLLLEKEGQDRTSIDLPIGQQWLAANITAALAASGKSSTRVIAVTYGGGMPDVSALLRDEGVHALLHAGYPSVQVRAQRKSVSVSLKSGQSHGGLCISVPIVSL